MTHRDDLESIGYVIRYLRKGSLPWSNIEYTNPSDTNELIKKEKLNILLIDICEFHSITTEIDQIYTNSKIICDSEKLGIFINYSRDLGIQNN